MDFPIIPSGRLFSQFGPAERTEYFGTLAEVGPEDVPMQALHGRNGWGRIVADVGPAGAKRFEEDERINWGAMTLSQRFDYAYGHALDRALSAASMPAIVESAAIDQRNGVAARSGGMADNLGAAIAGGYDPASAADAMFKTIFGG